MVHAYTDGGSRGNPGPAAIAIVIVDGGKVVAEHKECIGRTTNNQAEYRAVKKALEMASKMGAEEVHIVSDSKLVVSQLKGNWKQRDENLRPVFESIKDLEKAFVSVSYTLIRRCSDKFSKRADGLVNEALDDQA